MRMIAKIISTILLVLLVFKSFAQGESALDTIELKKVNHWQRTKELGLNATPLISSLIPFNLSKIETQVVSFRYKKYFDNNAFKFDLGINLGSDPISDFNYFHTSLGYEKRRALKGSFYYTSGWMFGLEIRETLDSFTSVGGLYISHFYGIEYHINDRFFVSTEAKIYGVLGFGSEFRFEPPISIFAFVRI